jgi:uncharacterized hydrophobic protein (TIGR00271 family)
MLRRATLINFQDRLAVALGCARDQRAIVVAGMLHRSPQESTAYWLQLVVAVGIATLGLVLGSTAVVIGAMLIAPLMGPIVSFGMGLAVGSPFLVARSGVRILLSVIVAIGSSSLLTLSLPFHELNAEIASRTTPTVLDLLTAGFCALAGVYASMRPGSEVASTAAGTSIGISLVPPLCASGYGVGVAAWNVAGGAALLFVTNFVAIVLVGTLAFAAAGFHQVNVGELEAGELHESPHPELRRSRMDERLRELFSSRGGPWIRLLMPFMLLAVVYIPLRKGLDEVAWQIAARREVNAAIAQLSSPVVQSRIRVERHQVEVTLVLAGSTADAEAAREGLNTTISEATDVTPRLDVFAVADAKTIAGLEATLRAPALPPLLVERNPALQLEAARKLVRDAVDKRWPSRAVGQPISSSITTSGEVMTVAVVHLGAALAPAAIEALERALAEDLGHAVRLHDAPVPNIELAPADGADVAFIAQLVPWLETAKTTEAISICVSGPPQDEAPSPPAPASAPVPSAPASAPSPPAPVTAAAPNPASSAPFSASLRELVQSYPRLVLQAAPEWRVRFVVGPCPAKDDAPAAPEAERSPPDSSPQVQGASEAAAGSTP